MSKEIVLSKKDGLSAALLYLSVIGLTSLQIWLLGGGGGVLQTASQCVVSQYLFAAADAALVWLFLTVRKKPWESIGLTTHRFGRALLLGCVAGVLIAVFNVISIYMDGARHLNSVGEILRMIMTFIFFAIPEELVFRGYLQTNLKGLIKNVYGADLINALLFMTIHLPAKLVPALMDGEPERFFAFLSENLLWAANLIVVALIYSYVCRKSGSLAAPIAAHTIVNLSYSLLIG